PGRMAVQQSVAEVLNRAMDRGQSSGVCGAICLDARGFTIDSRGELLPAQTAHIVGVAEGCAKLEPTASEAPVITVETNMRTLSISTRDDLVVAIARKATEH
ncbi:unnamed protein product, partial [Polarella glacialis]